MKKSTTTGRTTARPPRQRRSGNVGRRVRLAAINGYGKTFAGLEGVLVEKTSDPAWPYKVVLDNKVEVSLEDWQFEFTGAVGDMVQPLPQPQTDLVKAESNMAKEATKTRREPVGKTDAGNSKIKRAVPTSARRERVAPKVKASRSTAREGGKKPAKWNEVVLKALGGAKKMVLAEIYEAVEEAVGNTRPNNTVLKATVRRTLQALAKAGKTKMVEPGTWGVAGRPAKA